MLAGRVRDDRLRAVPTPGGQPGSYLGPHPPGDPLSLEEVLGCTLRFYASIATTSTVSVPPGES